MNNSSDRINRLTEKLALHAEESGQILFDGQWMTVEEAEQQYRHEELDGKFKQAELIFALALLFIASLLPFTLLAIVGGLVG